MRNVLSLFLVTNILFSCQHATSDSGIQDVVLKDKFLIPEGIAFSERNNTLYVSSIYQSKIVQVDLQSGAQSDFISAQEYDYMPGVGIWVNDDKKELYALGGYWITDEPKTALYIFDLDEGTLKNRYNPTDTVASFFNDLVQDNAGDLYLTDSKANAVYKYDYAAQNLSLFLKSEEIKFPNGIAISDDSQRLYVASAVYGVRSLNIASKEILNPRDTSNRSTGIDGLEFFEGHLYAIQNGVGENGFNFRKLLLNDDQDRIESVEEFASDKALDVPLTFCIAQKKGVVIANSNLEHLDQTKMTVPIPDSLRPTLLKVYELP